MDGEGFPTLYFPRKESDYLQLITSMWYNVNRFLPMKINSQSVIGEYFECQLPSLISETGPLTLTVKKLHGGHQTKITLSTLTATLGVRLDTVELPLPTNDVLWRTPKAFKAIDFLAEISTVGLPDCPDGAAKDLIIAVQATVQSGNQNKKIRKSLVGLTEDITRDKKVIFILINPNWTDFNANYSIAKEVTSGPAAARFQNCWYGQPSDFQGCKGLFNLLTSMLQSMHIKYKRTVIQWEI